MTTVEKIRAEIERLKGIGGIVPLDNREQKTGYESALNDIEIFLDSLEKECGDFPTTDEEMAKFLATHPKVKVPEKYKTPDWMFEKSEKPINHEGLQEEIALTYHDGSVADTSDIDHVSYENIAEYFYELGCRRTAEKYDEIEYNRQRAEEPVSDDLEEAVDNYKNDYPNHTDAFAWASKRAFIAGAEWQEEKDNEAAKLAEEKAFFAGVEWQEGQAPLPEDTVLFNKGVAEGKRLAEEELSDLLTIAHLQGADQMKKQMMEEAVEGVIEEVSFNNGEQHNTIRFSFDEESLHVENRIWMPRCGKDGDKVRIIIVKEE